MHNDVSTNYHMIIYAHFASSLIELSLSTFKVLDHRQEVAIVDASSNLLIMKYIIGL